MRLLRVGPAGHEIPAVEVDGRQFDLTPITNDIDGAFLASVEWQDAVQEALHVGSLTEIPADPSRRVGAPIARPQAIFCIGLNFAAHAAESGVAAPAEPIVFLKTPNTISGPHDDLVIPPGSTKTDWEVELGVVIGRPTYRLARIEDAWDHVAGYVLANDVSEREHQLERSGGQWSKGKIAPGFSPVGPYLVTADEVDPSDLGIRSFVNGEKRQDSLTSDLIFTVPEIIHHLSAFVRLEPGDLVLTGTPEGVALSGRFPYLVGGDVVEVEIDRLGRQTQNVVQGSDLA